MLNCTYTASRSACGQAAIVREDPTESDVVGITYTTIQRIMTQTKPDELLALYCFYAKETKRQKTQRIWCTTQFVCKGLGWGPEKVQKVKKRLREELGLIEDLKPKNKDGKFGKPFILVRFISHPSVLPTTGEKEGQMLTDSKGSALDRKTLREPRESPFKKGGVDRSAKWITDDRTKEEKLDSISPRRGFPSRRVFEEFVYDNDLDNLPNRQGDLYRELSLNKWCSWDSKSERWKPIVDWRKYVIGLNDKIDQCRSHRDF